MQIEAHSFKDQIQGTPKYLAPIKAKPRIKLNRQVNAKLLKNKKTRTITKLCPLNPKILFISKSKDSLNKTTNTAPNKNAWTGRSKRFTPA
ncbi:hypothetical protein [Bartonella sp. B1099]|uniref:hypothetical protein n=1 Tax=Bartonella sp. B1099 TaxID=2911422 RepID=UPI0020C20A3F|nr:hypothetical protein [Bartonella sp. B1099]